MFADPGFHPEQLRDLGGDTGPQAMAVRPRLVFGPTSFGCLQGRMPVLIDEDRGQFGDFLIGHLNYVKPAAEPRVPAKGG